jgi:hypothetical protein
MTSQKPLERSDARPRSRSVGRHRLMRQPRLIAIATIVERGPIGSSCAANVVPMHRMQRVGPSGASVVRPERPCSRRRRAHPESASATSRTSRSSESATVTEPQRGDHQGAANTVIAPSASAPPGRMRRHECRGFSAATLRQRPAAIAQVRTLPAASEIQRPRVLGSGVEVDRRVVPAQVTAELIDP